MSEGYNQALVLSLMVAASATYTDSTFAGTVTGAILVIAHWLSMRK